MTTSAARPPAPVVHFEIIGQDPVALRQFFGALFGWRFDVGHAATEALSEAGQYGFVTGDPTHGGINGGIGGGSSAVRTVLFYVGVDDVEDALARVEQLGGTRELGPVSSAGGAIVVGRFRDPEGNLIGVAGPR